MTQPVVIGLKEVYETMVGLDKKFDSFAADSDKRTSLLELEVTSLKKALDRAEDKKWKLNLALISAGVALLIGIVSPLLRMI